MEEGRGGAHGHRCRRPQWKSVTGPPTSKNIFHRRKVKSRVSGKVLDFTKLSRGIIFTFLVKKRVCLYAHNFSICFEAGVAPWSSPD